MIKFKFIIIKYDICFIHHLSDFSRNICPLFEISELNTAKSYEYNFILKYLVIDYVMYCLSLQVFSMSTSLRFALYIFFPFEKPSDSFSIITFITK